MSKKLTTDAGCPGLETQNTMTAGLRPDAIYGRVVSGKSVIGRMTKA